MARKIIFLFLIAFGKFSFAQTSLIKKNDTLFVSPAINYFPSFFSLQKNPHLFFENNSFSPLVFPAIYTYSIPRGAVFCRFENEWRNHFNFYLKIRAGTDEAYGEVPKKSYY
jgi:hypothetical protein